MSRQGERSTRPRGRPTEELTRPPRVAIQDGVVRCYYRSCHYQAGPYDTRGDAVLVATAHYNERHRRV